MKEKKTVRKIQELVYELTIDAVMTRKVISIQQDLLMSQLRFILRDNRISGTPIMDGEEMIGIISMEDLINWCINGPAFATVADRMNRNVITLFSDEPLIHAVSKLEHYGYGRIPVLQRNTKKLVGVITKGDVIEGLLKKLEIEYQEEEIHRYRASHFFEDLTADKVTLIFRYDIRHNDIEHGGEVASRIKKNLKRLGIHPNTVRRVAIAVYEAEMNVIIYAREAEVTMKIEPPGIHIEFQDRGPGIPDIQQALQPGFSTAPAWVRELGFGAGMGLGNIQKCSELLNITSEVNKGTCLQFNIEME